MDFRKRDQSAAALAARLAAEGGEYQQDEGERIEQERRIEEYNRKKLLLEGKWLPRVQEWDWGYVRDQAAAGDHYRLGYRYELEGEGHQDAGGVPHAGWLDSDEDRYELRMCLERVVERAASAVGLDVLLVRCRCYEDDLFFVHIPGRGTKIGHEETVFVLDA